MTAGLGFHKDRVTIIQLLTDTDTFFPRQDKNMCGRFADHVIWSLQWVEALGDWPEEITPSFNRAPTQSIAAFTPEGGRAMRWGLVPSWSKEPKTRYATFNARAEEVAQKPAFRSAWKESRRCLVPVLGYYEWLRSGDRKQPYFIRDAGEDPLFLAGLWEQWQKDGQSLLSCTILTREAVPGVAHIHNRMPVVVAPERLGHWLSSSRESAHDIIRDDRSEHLFSYPVTTLVNNARNDDPRCIEPLA